MSDFISPAGLSFRQWADAFRQTYTEIDTPLDATDWRRWVDQLYALNPTLVVVFHPQFERWEEWAETFMDELT